ncbi:hypothetical protein ACFQZQ_03835 [Lysobacter koreensis]|uniref:Uncharacterized protein n=1 Tax=Lysobacter koreensis TaxID=266122 RepID=A0ABW2YJ24_9GAMM
MTQNLVSIEFTEAEQMQLVAAVAAVVAQMAGKTIALDADRRRDLFKMGDRSEAFVRQALDALDQNRQVVPPSFGLDEALADRRALDVLRPLLRSLEQVVERLQDTEMALGSDMMETAVEGYRLLKVSGGNQGLDGLVKELGGRFARRPRAAVEPVPA